MAILLRCILEMIASAKINLNYALAILCVKYEYLRVLAAI